MDSQFFRFVAKRLIAALATCVCALYAVESMAVCTTPQEFILPVGNIKKDAACKFSDIQTAIDHATCPGSTIQITPSLTYTAQHLTITSKQLFLYGAAKCSDKQTSTPGPQVTISGAGHTGDSVISIKGNSHVAMQNLFISGGQQGISARGGGVSFDGDGSLTIASTTIVDNLAGYGGGIYLKGEKIGAELKIGSNTLVENNIAAHDGGGIYGDANTSVSISGTNTSVYGNNALGVSRGVTTENDGYGGGIVSAQGSSLRISAAGVFGLGGGVGLGAVESNNAQMGGGIALLSSTEGCVATLDTSAPDSTHPVQISGNHAWVVGGAIYMKSYSPGLTDGFCSRNPSYLNDFRVASNLAPDGAAFYLDWDTALGFIDLGTILNLNWPTGDPNVPEDPNQVASTTCVAVANCNTIESNITQDAKGQVTQGAMVVVGTSSQFLANRVKMLHNTGGNLIHILGNNDNSEQTRLSNALLVDNTLSIDVLKQDNDDAHVTIDSSTIAHNTLKGAFVLDVHSGLTLTYSLIGETTKALHYTGDAAGLQVDSVVAAIATGLTLGASVMQTDPGFVDPNNGNFALADKSIALDFAPITALHADLNGQTRSVDLPAVNNRFGARDLGALERQLNVAAAVNGASVTASSTLNANFPATAIIDGDRIGVNWANGGGWNDATFALFPDSVQINFNATRSIKSIIVYTLQNNFAAGVEPSDTTTFSAFGLTAFDVQVLDPTNTNWITVQSVTNNNLVKRTIILPAIVSTTAIRIICNAAIDGQYSRIVEVEAFGG